MKMKKIIAALLATAVATTMAVSSAFAATTVDLAAEYGGSWSGTPVIPVGDLQAIGGDVKITLDVEIAKTPLPATQHLIGIIDNTDGWPKMFAKDASFFSSDTVTAKGSDGFFVIPEGTTSVEFIISEEGIASITGDGILCQVEAVWVKSATLEAADIADQGALATIEDDAVEAFCFPSKFPAEEAPAATENAETGNAPIVGMVAVMALAGVAMVATKSKK